MNTKELEQLDLLAETITRTVTNIGNPCGKRNSINCAEECAFWDAPRKDCLYIAFLSQAETLKKNIALFE